MTSFYHTLFTVFIIYFFSFNVKFIFTDTALQPQGVVTPYESPENQFSEAKEPATASALTAALEEQETISMGVSSTDRSMGGGATERELASGDTFPDLDVPLFNAKTNNHR